MSTTATAGNANYSKRSRQLTLFKRKTSARDGSKRSHSKDGADGERIKTEHEEQRELVRDFRQTYPGVLIFSIPNGGLRTKQTALKLRIEGCVAGIPDLYVPEWGLWIEMKRVTGGRLSPEQREQIAYLERIGHAVIVGKGKDDAWAKINQFLASK